MIESAGRPSSLRARVAAAAVVAGALFALAGCGGVDAPPRLGAAFLGGGHDAPLRVDGPARRVVASDPVCGRRPDREPAQRRRSAPALAGMAGIAQPLGGDPRRFAELALDTFCS